MKVRIYSNTVEVEMTVPYEKAAVFINMLSGRTMGGYCLAQAAENGRRGRAERVYVAAAGKSPWRVHAGTQGFLAEVVR